MTETPPRSPLQVPDSWDAVADGYAEHLRSWTAYADEAVRLAGLQPSDQVLDVGCGPGNLAFTAAASTRKVTAVDFSPGMIEALEKRKQREGVENIEARVMDAQTLDLPDASFDAAFSLFAFMFFPDRKKAFAEIKRVLKPGARLVIATWAPIDRRPVMKLGFDALAEALPDMPKPTKGDLQSIEECEGEFGEAGFVEVSSRALTDSVHVESAEHYLDLMVRTAAPFAVMRKRIGEEAWQGVMQRLKDALARRLPATGADLSAEALLTVGTAP
jgi:ubiquinone/menaquinone biosynthesis C-methylase UbiE